MKISVNQAASFTGKAGRRINSGDSLARLQSKIVSKKQSYVGRKSSVPASNAVNITLNALAYGTYSTAKNRKNADGNFYTITFPDDFVHTINDSGTISVADQAGSVTIPKDPFLGYRSSTAPYQIDAEVKATIQVPYGMSIGSNSHARHVHPSQVLLSMSQDDFFPYLADGTALSSVNEYWSLLFFVPASSDPCFLFDFDSTKVTPLTLITSSITIENSGNTIGGGGHGGKGSYTKQSGKYATNRGLPGGGGGMGLHQEYSPSSEIDTPHLHNYRDWNRAFTGRTPRANGAPVDETGFGSGGTAGVGGQSDSFGEHRDYGAASLNGTASANGTAGSLTSAGSGGAYGTHGNFVSSPVATSQVVNWGSYGGWGGNVVYVKSNVQTAEAYSGMSFNFINRPTGFMFPGCGGGGGSHQILSSGGSGGTWYGEGTGEGTDILGGSSIYKHRGQPGLMLFRNTSNLEINVTYETQGISHSLANTFRGREFR